LAKDHLRNGGSITVTTGVLAMHPMLGSASISMVNAGLEGFVRAAALEMPRKLRINAVSPPWVKETMVKFGMDPTPGLASADVAKAYVAAVEGSHQGKIIDSSCIPAIRSPSMTHSRCARKIGLLLGAPERHLEIVKDGLSERPASTANRAPATAREEPRLRREKNVSSENLVWLRWTGASS
jgi:NAD(P)-dependent dehydrogenase (short-subunit alcohol dehydrogenase family)